MSQSTTKRRHGPLTVSLDNLQPSTSSSSAISSSSSSPLSSSPSSSPSSPSSERLSQSSMSSLSTKKILVVGKACVDIINVAMEYPAEDTDSSLVDQQVCRGGNASNTAVILGQLGCPVEWLGTLANDSLSRLITDDLDQYDVMYDNAQCHPGCSTPVACVVINQSSGSRTIFHKNKDLPELNLNGFEKVDLANYHWIHFEGRKNQPEMEKMISEVERFNESLLLRGQAPIIISIEAEKRRNVAPDFLGRGDVVFISKDYSRSLGYETGPECLMKIQSTGLLRDSAKAICPWGEKGAFGLDDTVRIVHSPAFPPIKVVDTLGAGDTFIAGVIFGLSRGDGLEEAMKHGCILAGHKVGRQGLNIHDIKETLLPW